MSRIGNYNIKWFALLPYWMQNKNKDMPNIRQGKLILLEEIKDLPIDEAKGMVNDVVNRHLNHLTQTQVYMLLVELMVDCEKYDSKIAKEIYNHCDMITNKWDNG